jgi:hypothetical protein
MSEAKKFNNTDDESMSGFIFFKIFNAASVSSPNTAYQSKLGQSRHQRWA